MARNGVRGEVTKAGATKKGDRELHMRVQSARERKPASALQCSTVPAARVANQPVSRAPTSARELPAPPQHRRRTHVRKADRGLSNGCRRAAPGPARRGEIEHGQRGKMALKASCLVLGTPRVLTPPLPTVRLPVWCPSSGGNPVQLHVHTDGTRPRCVRCIQ